ITIVRTTDDESPKGVVLDIKACTEATTETTIVTGQTTIPSVTGETGETSATTGIIGTGSSQSQGIGTG
ncbi:unnamed protein product, partial [Rotaria sp. Silwood1]